ncbi:DUF4422 domain-containing protein [Acetobacter persici]|uniref:DUF4422 domain-containing protein n=1 Tax=Acetobacter persici TaxID=1076596 RepID=UPI0020CBDEB3|nr:DUF4422 domain-containing protein [Acetobacter persici]MCP9319774.1 DUF4422 domain-containing protein [Acetobacter persici]
MSASQPGLGPVHIYVCHHAAGIAFEDDVFRPIQVGRALASTTLPMRGDDTGDNISSKNREYCELTALYWAWKNDPDAAWIGFMHYRRFLDFACTGLKTDQFGCIPLPDMTPQTLKQMGLNAATVRKTIENTPDACAILPEKWSVRNVGFTSFYQHYVEADYHFAHDLALTRSVIADLYPDDLPAFDTVMAADEGYFTNVFVFRRDLFDTYCAWLFAILSEVERKADLTNYSAQARRIYGYLGERLFNVFMASPHVPKTGVIERARCFFENTKTGKEVVLPKSPAAPAANAVTLVTAADENFVPHLAALLESIKASFNPDRFLDLIVLDGGIPPLKRNLLRRQFHMGLPASKGSLTFLDCQHMYRGISTHMHFSPATFYRLSLGQLLQNHTRALYIDCDTIVLADLCRLWDTPLNGAVIGATPDLIMKNFVKAGIRSMEETGALPASQYLSAYLGLQGRGDAYFQAGVILFDLDAFRAANISDAAIKDLSNRRYWFLDQDILNKYLIGKVKMLDTSWNCVNSIREIFPHLNADWRAKVLEDLKDPKIVHYAGYEAKPWNNRRAPLSFFYWYFLRRTFWYESVFNGEAGPGDDPAPFRHSLLRRVLTRGWHLLPRPLRRPLSGVASRLKQVL